MAFESLPQFYCSKEWREFRAALIHERTSPKTGMLYDEYSGEELIKSHDIVLHHTTPLTMQNVNDYAISLNPKKIMVVSHRSHNELHKRYGYCTQRKVYLVTGAPCSGKTSFVINNKGNADLIVDMDSIWECISGDRYRKPNALKTNAFALRDCLLDMVRTRAGKWERAWVIATLPRKGERDRQLQSLGAEHILIDTDRDTCLQRLDKDSDRRAVKKEWAAYIDKYFADLQTD